MNSNVTVENNVKDIQNNADNLRNDDNDNTVWATMVMIVRTETLYLKKDITLIIMAAW